MTLHPMFRAWPISRPVQRLAGIRRLERNARRWRLSDSRLDLRGDLVLGMPCAASLPTSKPGRPRNRVSKTKKLGESTAIVPYGVFFGSVKRLKFRGLFALQQLDQREKRAVCRGADAKRRALA